MGQYWVVVNLDKHEFVHAHKLGTGLKLWEQVASHPGTGTALLILCAAMPKARGGGDLDLNMNRRGPEEYPAVAKRTIGRWAGDRVALVGDYAENGDLAPEHEASTIYGECGGDGKYKDVTDDVCQVIEHELHGKFEGDGWREFKRSE